MASTPSTAVRVDGFDGGVVVGAQYGQIAFITSTNSDDIKGLDLIVTDSSQPRGYVPAPNPLQPLSIPTVNQPIELAPSVRYGPIQTTVPFFAATGTHGRSGPDRALLFVRGAASPNISVIGAANVPESLRQLTNGLLQQSAGVVTAISARMTTSEANVVLYYATFDGQDGTVWERVLQNPQSRSPSFTGPFPTSLTSVTDCSGLPPVVPQRRSTSARLDRCGRTRTPRCPPFKSCPHCPVTRPCRCWVGSRADGWGSPFGTWCLR